ncbi:MAG: hypothetical protein ACQETH_13400 [Candidatus Rifleibacteriota bacterium]
MFESRVKLLSDYAATYSEQLKHQNDGSPFWQALMALFTGSRRDLHISGPVEELPETEAELENEGFAPFCEIDGRKIYFRKKADNIEVSIWQDREPWDLSEWGTGKEFVIRFIAECYFMVTRDDFKIDEEEHRVLKALIGYIQPTQDEIVQARNTVYWTLVEKVLEDNLVTDEESETLNKIREALEIDDSDAKEIHEQSLLEKFNLAKEAANENNQLDLEQLEKIKRMADRLGINPEDFK